MAGAWHVQAAECVAAVHKRAECDEKEILISANAGARRAVETPRGRERRGGDATATPQRRHSDATAGRG